MECGVWKCFVSGMTQIYVCCDHLPGGQFMWGLDTVALATVVYDCFGLSFSLSVHQFIFRAALDRRTIWRDLRTVLTEIGELQGRKVLQCFFSPAKGLKKPGDVFGWRRRI